MINKPRVVVLGAGFGGLELSTLLSESFGDRLDVALIDKSDSFVFGYSNLDGMFGRSTPGVAIAERHSGAADPTGEGDYPTGATAPRI